MTIPAPTDPIRPVRLAVRSLRLLGVLFVLVGVVTALQGLRPHASLLVMSYVGLTHAVPGVLYLVCAALLPRGRRAGVLAAMGLALTHFVLVAGNLAAYVQMLVAGGVPPTLLFVALAVGFLAVAALAQLMYHLVKSLRVVSADPAALPPDAAPVYAAA
jgi:hypothetical protein